MRVLVVVYDKAGISFGSTTALICEASDAAVSGAPVEDGQSDKAVVILLYGAPARVMR